MRTMFTFRLMYGCVPIGFSAGFWLKQKSALVC
jgi:hypothetical protein